MTESSTPPAPAAFSYPGHGPNARTGVAICHGFTGSPLSVLPWARHLAAQGFAVSVPLLPGHGTHWRDLARQGWQDWYRSFETAYLDLAARTDDCYVAGLSMGGTIALRTAARHSVAGVAAVNPGLSFYDRRVRIVGLLKYFQRTTTPIQEENSTAATTDDGDYSADAAGRRPPVAPAVRRDPPGPAVRLRPGPGVQVGHRRRGPAVVPGAAAQAARVPGTHGGSPPAQRARCHPGRRCAATL